MNQGLHGNGAWCLLKQLELQPPPSLSASGTCMLLQVLLPACEAAAAVRLTAGLLQEPISPSHIAVKEEQLTGIAERASCNPPSLALLHHLEQVQELQL